jgi:hypothetical protein
MKSMKIIMVWMVLGTAIVPIFGAHFGNFGLAKFPTGTANSKV